MVKVGLIGAGGYVGSALLKSLTKKNNYSVTPIYRSNYNYWKKKEFDIVINSAMPAARFWAKKYPQLDFIETVKKTSDIVYSFNYKKLVHISSISARTELHNVYGRHKAAAEKIASFDNNLIFRLTSTFSQTLTKGVLIDILSNNKVYVDKKSRYSFSQLETTADLMANHIDASGIIEIGARNSISLNEIVKTLGKKITFEGEVDIQEVENPQPEYPDAYDVIPFLKEQMKLNTLLKS